jgi:putative iron-dependent peroxidase
VHRAVRRSVRASGAGRPTSGARLPSIRPQPGIFALGTKEHCFVELDAIDDAELVPALAHIATTLLTTSGVDVVAGFRPELWAATAPGQSPAGYAGWDDPLAGADGFTMPATQNDAWLWIAGGDRTVVFEAARAALAELTSLARVATETYGWPYRHDRDLTGFVDGTENPPLLEAGEVVVVPSGAAGEGATSVLFQLWSHDSRAWDGIGTHAQELAMGRTKDDSTELAPDVMPDDAHVARTSFDRHGVEQHIFRRNVAYGGASDHGTVFVGFCRDQSVLREMLERMAGATDGVRDALTHYLTPVTGAYYTVPSLDALAAACRTS